MHGVAGFDDIDDLLGVAVNQGDFTGVTKGNYKDIIDVVAVHFLGRAFIDRYHDLPAFLHFLHAPFRRAGGFMLNIAGHHVDLLGTQVAGGAPIRHAGRRAEFDQRFEVLSAFLSRDIGS